MDTKKAASNLYSAPQWAIGAGNYDAQSQVDYRLVGTDTLKVVSHGDQQAANSPNSPGLVKEPRRPSI